MNLVYNFFFVDNFSAFDEITVIPEFECPYCKYIGDVVICDLNKCLTDKQINKMKQIHDT